MVLRTRFGYAVTVIRLAAPSGMTADRLSPLVVDLAAWWHGHVEQEHQQGVSGREL